MTLVDTAGHSPLVPGEIASKESFNKSKMLDMGQSG